MTTILDKITNFLCKLRISKKVLAVLFVIAFLLSLIPIVITAFYSVPTYDDYNFGYYTHKSVVDGDNFFSAILETNNHFYNKWQGFFTYNFLASVQLFNINVNLYFVSDLIVIALLIFSLFYFGKVILKDIMKLDTLNFLLVSIPIVSLILQFFPDIAEGFYWMDGSLIVVVHALLLFEFSFIIKLYLKNTRKKKIIFAILSVIIAIVISGADAITFLTNLLVLAVFLIYSIHKKSKVIKIVVALLLVAIIGFIIAMVAPGNDVRLLTVDESNRLSFPMAIIYALVYSVVYFGKWMTICFIAVILFCSVIFYSFAQNSKYEFKNPFLVFILCYGIYASRLSVELYALGTLGSGRQYDVYYIFFVLCMSFSVLYFVGWLSKRKYIQNGIKYVNKISVIFLAFIIFAFGAGCFHYGVKKMSSVATTVSFMKGNTQKYNQEMKQRIDVLEDTSEEDVVFLPLSVYPSIFKTEPLSDDVNYWTNKSTARYYTKNSVAVVDK